MSPSDIKLLDFLKEIIAFKYLHRGPSLSEFIPSLRASNSSTVGRDYQYASSQYLRHVTASRLCTCFSELAPSLARDMSKFTSDDHASLVIRVIQCIVARLSTNASQCEREQTLGFVSAG